MGRTREQVIEQMVEIRIFSDRVLVKGDEPEGKYGAIIIPDQAKERPTRGTIVAYGEGRWTRDGLLVEIDRLLPGIHEGMRVLYGHWAGQQITVGGEEYWLMRSDDIFAELKDED